MPSSPRAADHPRERLRETIALVVLSVAAVLTAWSGFQSSQWGGEMSIAFSEASSARLEEARYEGEANAARQADLTIYGVYVQARATGDDALASYVEERFTPHFRVAYDAWVAAGEQTNGPFGMPEYVPPGTTEAAQASDRAEAAFAEALVNNVRGDRYTMLTVLFAIAMFFAAVAERVGRLGSRWFMTATGGLILARGAAVLATYPADF